jgi:hypothetical protein
MNPQARRALLVLGAIALIFFVVILVPILLGTLYTEWLWFDSLGYLSVYRTRLLAEAGLFVVGGLIVLVFVSVNWFLIAPWLARGQEQVIRVGRSLPRALREYSLAGPFIIAALMLALIMGLRAASNAMEWLVFRNAVPFGIEDPIFELDAAFYVFQLPFYRFLLGWSIFLVGAALAGTVIYYLTRDLLREREPAAHLSVLGALLMLLFAGRYWLDRLSLLDSARGLVFGAGYTDVHARIPLLTTLAVIVVLGAVLLLVNTVIRRWRLLLIVAGLWIAVAVLGPVYPGLVQRFRVNPNELAVERPYIRHNIDFTRYAFDLEDVLEFDFEVGAELTPQLIEENRQTIDNIRLWDWRPLQITYEQLQELRLYYTFYDVDVDSYVIDEELTEVMLAARELDVDQLPDQAQTWINRHLIFTHGYGLCLSPVNVVTEEGLPLLLVRDIPPQSAVEGLEITRPEIYFGEVTENYVIVGTTEEEFDRPSGDQNIYTRYEGPDGVEIGGLLRQLAFALRFGDQQIIFSRSILPDSRILFHRTLEDRVETLAPMLWYDEDPYLVIADGRLFWLYDAYTQSDRFPYSQPFRDAEFPRSVNYIRNSVKIVIDAYTGETRFFVVDPDDPILQTYQAIFPDLFVSDEEMAPELRAHWRYPEQLFRIQAAVYATYHMEDPQVFYNKEDLWEVPVEALGGSREQPMTPYYVVMRLPGEEEIEFIMMRPYVPAERRNMIAWLYADSDGADYGQLGVFKFTKEELVYGPRQIGARFEQDPFISQQLTLWDQRGSEAIRGNLIVLPIDNAVLYVQPLYLQAQAGSIPELRRVLVAYGNRVVMAENLATALAEVLVGTAQEPTPEVPLPTDVAALAQAAQDHYLAARECLRLEDWTCYGRELDALSDTLEALVEATQLQE